MVPLAVEVQAAEAPGALGAESMAEIHNSHFPISVLALLLMLLEIGREAQISDI